MGLGLDIADILDDVGSSFSILTRDPVVSGEKLLFSINLRASHPFLREHLRGGVFKSDTVVKNGDVINIAAVDQSFLVMSHAPRSFENECFNYTSSLYRINVSGELWAPSGESEWSSNEYRKQTEFSLKHSTVYGLFSEALSGVGFDENQEFVEVYQGNNEMYIPDIYDIQPNDRYVPTSGEYYRVTGIRKRRFHGIDIAFLEIDRR